MENKFAVTAGKVWKIEQAATTMEVVLYKYGHPVGRWQENRLLTWEELYNMLLQKSYEMRGEK